MTELLNDLTLLLKATSDALTAGVAIVAFSLLINAFTFKIRDAVTNTFTVILLAVVIIFGADAFFTVVRDEAMLVTIIKIHWLGLTLLPTAYFLFSDSLLTQTGKPSRGKRRITGYLSIAISVGFAYLLFNDLLVGRLITGVPPAPFFERTLFNDIFSIFFFGVMGLSWYNFIRTYKRTLTTFSQRRMLYLIICALGPALGSFPYLLYGSEFAAYQQNLFWLLSIVANAMVGLGLIGMTYAVSFYGFPWPDRVIKSRLFRWLMRGPITASLTLGVTTIISRLARQYGIDASMFVILAMVGTIVLFEFLITLFAPIWERILFHGDGRHELEKIRALEEKLLTSNDIRHFLELILAALCDRLQISGASLLVNEVTNSSPDVYTGTMGIFIPQEKRMLFDRVTENQQTEPFTDQGRTIIPVLNSNQEESSNVLALVVLNGLLSENMEEDKHKALDHLLNRASLALEDRMEQEKLFASLEMLTPRVSVIQDLLANSRIEQERILNGDGKLQPHVLESWVKDALSQIWGGPKLLQNPIMSLNAVQQQVEKSNETPINAVRNLLRQAAEYLKPEGERQYTNEWILYNLIDLKFFEGWKVRDVARKLSLSEADLYRKQRVAISEISKKIIELEKEASQ